ncbi:uncharacterized protein LOC143197624 [Rhynchophorus ferrugineus]|uniref:uncharacterized protein LOC143197624 n=1 Tax=Rhynchophorus ferrugineus TaxID=354439 RepID=UPI003FCD4261
MKRKTTQEEQSEQPLKIKKKKNQNTNTNITGKDVQTPLSNQFTTEKNKSKKKSKAVSKKTESEKEIPTDSSENDDERGSSNNVNQNGVSFESNKDTKKQNKKENQKKKMTDQNKKPSSLKGNKTKDSQEQISSEIRTGPIHSTTTESVKKTKKKVRIDETESLKIKKEMADTEPHFSAKQLPAKIIKSKMNKALTEDVKVSPVTVQSPATNRTENTEDEITAEESNINFNGTKVVDDTSTTEDSDLEVFYINKQAENEARKKGSPSKKHCIYMPKEDQDILVQRIQECIPENDTKNYKTRITQLEWDKVPFKNYTLDECQKVWCQLLKKVRHYRLLIEITRDIKDVIEKSDFQNQTKVAAVKRHPDMPKRPLSSYFLYYIRKKEKIAKEHPDADITELNKFIGEKYCSLPLEKKQKYEELAAKNREQYKKDLAEFYSKHPEFRKTIIKEPKVNVKAKKEKPPQKPDGPYKLFFLSEMAREKIDDHYKTEFRDVCREKWKQMPDIKKLTWINTAEERIQTYEKELKEYMAKYPEYVPNTKPILSREELNLKDKLAGKPKKPPATAYSLFLSTVMQSEEISGIPTKERMNYCSIKWKNMTEKEKDEYRDRVVKVNEQYQKKFNIYLESLPEDKRQEELLLSAPKKKKNESTKSQKSGKQKPSAIKKTSPKKKETLSNPIPPPRSVYKYFAKNYEGDNAKEAWKNLNGKEKKKYESELTALKDRYIKDFEAYLKSLTKEELDRFCANRMQVQNSSSSEESESESENSSGDTSESSDSESDEN